MEERAAGVKCNRDLRSPEQAGVQVNQDGLIQSKVDSESSCKVRVITTQSNDEDNWNRLWQRLDAIETKMSKVDTLELEVNKLKTESEGLKSSVGMLREQVTIIDKADNVSAKEFAVLKAKCSDLENRLRRNNLVIYNLPEGYEGDEGGFLHRVCEIIYYGKYGI